jgi:hypothetical protein
VVNKNTIVVPTIASLASLFWMGSYGCERDNSIKAIMENKYPKGSKVIYEKDDVEGYIKIATGSRSNVFAIWTKVEGRPSEYRVANGDLQFIFETIYGWDRPRIFVESTNRNAYTVTFNPEDPNALRIVASQLRLRAIKKNKKIWALTIRIGADGHRLKAITIEHDWVKRLHEQGRVKYYCDANGDWPLEAISMRNFATFLETQYRQPVVDLTGLEGFWSFKLSKANGKVYPDKKDEVMSLDETGLVLQWEELEVPVLVVEDIAKQ